MQNSNNNKKYHEIFEYNWNELCISEIEKKITNYCPNNLSFFNGNFYAILSWNKLKKDQYATLYQLSSTINKIESENFWLSIYDNNSKETIGTARWSCCTLQPKFKVVGKSSSKFKYSQISAASGVLNHFQNQNILIDYRDKIRKIHLYSKDYQLEVIKSKDFINWLHN